MVDATPRPAALSAMPPRIVLGHGAAGSAASMTPYVDGLRIRGVAARAIDLPRSRPDAAVQLFVRAGSADPSLALGGHSFGGRMASLAAARVRVPALVLFSYPLHRPGRPDLGLRTEHWPAIACPVLLLSGERDPFARPDLLQGAVALLPDARLIAFPGAGHGLRGHLDEALDIAAAFLLTRGRRPA